MSHTFEALSDKHAEDVMEIFNYYIENSMFAYPEHALSHEFFTRFLDAAKTHPAFAIANADGETVGFCMLRQYSPFPVFRRSAEVSYFLHRNFTGKGIGTSALEKLTTCARDMGIKTLLAEVSSENTQSIAFHIRNGFVRCGELKNIGEKNGKSFSVIWLQKSL